MFDFLRSWTEWLNLFGILIGLVGLAFALAQTFEAKRLRLALDTEKRSKNAAIWHNIAMTLNAYETIDDARQILEENSNKKDCAKLAAKLSSARRCIVDQYLELLKSAVLDEPSFSERTIEAWVKQGKLENDWRVKQARKFLNT